MNQFRRGMLIVISGPSGVGKGTVCKSLLERDANLCFSVSATTRAPRPGEVDGESYFFLCRAEFEDMIAHGEFLEYMNVFGLNYYGTPRAYVERKMAEGKDVLLDIDVGGAMKIKGTGIDAVMVFLLPPSRDELKRRLTCRGTESPEVIERRLSEAGVEMDAAIQYDYAVVNDSLEQAVNDVERIIHAERLRVKRRVDI